MKVIDVPLRFARCQIVLGDVPTLIDTGTANDVPRILAALRAHGLEPTDVERIVLTHADGDHAGGAYELQDRCRAEVVAHADEQNYLAGTLPPGFGLVKRAVIALSGKARTPEVARWLRGGENLDGIEIVHTPGHTPGHISLVAGTTLIAGDALTTGARCREVPRLMTADRGRSLVAIRKLVERCVERAVDAAYSGHGAPIEKAGEKLRAFATRLADTSS